ncbi:MAG: ATP-binding protein [Gemmatimonadales bacterium]
MPLPTLYGHEGVRLRLGGAIAAGRLPQALLFEGPRGVGKQRLALWLAQTLLCEREDGRGEPCGDCRSCRLVAGLAHPDLHWFIPVESPRRGGDPQKQIELVEEALGEEFARRREQPLYPPPSGLASHGIAAIRLLLRRLVLTPAMGGMKVFIIGDAERLVPQTGAEQAANALLKALEEPPHDTQFVLTTGDHEALLPTILSRVVRVKVQRLTDSVVTSFVQNELASQRPPRDVASHIVAAEGCPGRLIANGGDARGAGSGAPDAVTRAARGPAAGRYAVALAQKPFEARGTFSDMLDALVRRLRDEIRNGGDSAVLVRAIGRVLDARELAQGNVNPQLLTAVLAEDLAGVA